MTLIYKFKKEKLESGLYATRPRILVELRGSHGSIVIPALIDSGCDMTVVPEGIAEAIGLTMEGDKHRLYGYRESTEALQSKATITFLGKEQRQSVILTDVPVLIALREEGVEEEQDITLGVEGIFDHFEITFRKTDNRIVLKRANKKLFFGGSR